MHEDVLRAVLHQTVDHIGLPPNIWDNIQNKIYNRKTWSTYKKVGLVAFIMALFCATSIVSITSAGAIAQNSWLFKNKLGTYTLTVVQNTGKELAGITPTLFLPTTLSHAKEVAKIEIKIPTYLPEGVNLGPNTPAVVGRFGSYETVATMVTENIKGILLDIRQTNAKDLTVNYPPDVKITSEKINIANHEGILICGDGLAPTIYWTDGKYSFRMFGPLNKTELIKTANSMK